MGTVLEEHGEDVAVTLGGGEVIVWPRSSRTLSLPVLSRTIFRTGSG
jgi:hypothetical protein